MNQCIYLSRKHSAVHSQSYFKTQTQGTKLSSKLISFICNENPTLILYPSALNPFFLSLSIPQSNIKSYH
ncbi:hypothetical protein M8J76_006439 [Diaphorina citri]|nr:hypothetical protein M8J76_006439 [Diaphorina citri]